ncbi:uncharacterized protein LOC131997983 [Stomoxys calcitrans]|uniref:uncharacterized protein LOC131997983 n=1 Tax=Stomoxys calcitrans TaxID=35570 RepID=UPI0027E2F817|nr:uncharacterized protein LOC131997983 [Stomoxys calcitrans]
MEAAMPPYYHHHHQCHGCNNIRIRMDATMHLTHTQTEAERQKVMCSSKQQTIHYEQPSIFSDQHWFRFTNIKCAEFDSSFATFTKCRLNMVKRGVVALNVYVKLFQLPVNNVSVNLSLWKKASGYRPFLYNMTEDFCRFQRNRKRVPFLNIFFNLLVKDSNINHTCPFNHDIIVKNLVLDEEMFKFLPLPNGEYMFRLKVAAYNDWKADIKTYVMFNTKFGE